MPATQLGEGQRGAAGRVRVVEGDGAWRKEGIRTEDERQRNLSQRDVRVKLNSLLREAQFVRVVIKCSLSRHNHEDPYFYLFFFLRE